MTGSAAGGELEVLGIVARRLDRLGINYMLTGSFAMAFYATPRMTRDIDLVIALDETVIPELTAAFQDDFYIDSEDALEAVRSERMFNLMHLESGIKIDLIIRKLTEYRQVEFARREQARIGEIETWIVSREDLVLSKLLWSQDSGSELQRRDVKSLLPGTTDQAYLQAWAERLGVGELLREVSA
jgi:hypothetical protein